MKTKMSKELATAVVEAWKADNRVVQVTGLVDFLKELGLYFPYTARVQGLVGRYAKLASNALWAGNSNTAITCLMKYGMDTKTYEERPKRRESYIKTNRTSGRYSNPKSDWKYVK